MFKPYRSYFLLFSILSTTFLGSCVIVLLNGHLSHGQYISPSETFKCTLPGGAFSSQLKITDSHNNLGETVTFKLTNDLIWKVDHLIIGKHKIAALEQNLSHRGRLEQAKKNYINYFLKPHLDVVEIKWEQYVGRKNSEVLHISTFLIWGENEEVRDMVFALNNGYLNVLQHSQKFSKKLNKITSNSLDLYNSCVF